MTQTDNFVRSLPFPFVSLRSYFLVFVRTLKMNLRPTMYGFIIGEEISKMEGKAALIK